MKRTEEVGVAEEREVSSPDENEKRKKEKKKDELQNVLPSRHCFFSLMCSFSFSFSLSQVRG